ncbi:MAG TPA: FAD-binding oxidoreductase, partial [Anaerolineae bacterium]|nr:FAD-binding oxidoreductase [Anaerolineae bacterium]
MISESFWQDLRRETRGAVKTDKYSRILYSTDASIYKVEPLGVFFPQHRDEIQAAVEIAARHSVPVLMRG